MPPSRRRCSKRWFPRAACRRHIEQAAGTNGRQCDNGRTSTGHGSLSAGGHGHAIGGSRIEGQARAGVDHDDMVASNPGDGDQETLAAGRCSHSSGCGVVHQHVARAYRSTSGDYARSARVELNSDVRKGGPCRKEEAERSSHIGKWRASRDRYCGDGP